MFLVILPLNLFGGLHFSVHSGNGWLHFIDHQLGLEECILVVRRQGPQNQFRQAGKGEGTYF